MKHRSTNPRSWACGPSLALLTLILTPPLLAGGRGHGCGHGLHRVSSPSAVRYYPAVSRHADRWPSMTYRHDATPVYYGYGRAPYAWASPRVRSVAPPAAAAQQPTIIIIQQPAPAPAIAPAPPAAAPAAAAPAPAAAMPPPPARNPNALAQPSGEPGEVYLWIEQPEAAVHLDGDYLGTGEDIAGLEAPLKLSSGVHVLEVQHADYGAERLVFAVPSADEVLVEINLSGDRRGRKARLRTAYEVEARLRVLRR